MSVDSNFASPQPNFGSPQPSGFAHGFTNSNPLFAAGTTATHPSSFGVPPSSSFSVPMTASTAPKPAPVSSGPAPPPPVAKRARFNEEQEQASAFLMTADAKFEQLAHEMTVFIDEENLVSALLTADEIVKHLKLGMEAAKILGDKEKFNALGQNLSAVIQKAKEVLEQM